jgi:hypothetical protein
MKQLLITLLTLAAFTLNAQDRLFTYTYQSNVLNKGQKELEVWTTMRNTREDFYRAFDHRLEFEIGLGSKLQTAFYLNYGYSAGISGGEGAQSLSTSTDYSFANEWKLKLTDPVANAIGSAAYFEYKLGTEEIELEAKLIFDKQIGKLIQALNVVGEYEVKNEYETIGDDLELEHENEVKVLFHYGLSYQLNKNFAFGFEAMNKNKYEEDEWHYSVLSAGPCISYNMDGFWVNLSCMPQITNFKTGDLELAKNEKVQTRLIFSYVF